MRTCDPKSFVSVGAAAPDPPTRLFVTYMSAQEQSNKLEAIAIRGFIIFRATVCSSPRAGPDRLGSVMQLSCRTRGKIAGNHLVNIWRGELLRAFYPSASQELRPPNLP